MKLINRTGQRFGRLTVIERAENSSSGRVQWLCRCECGSTTVVLGSNLKSGKQKSCGCLHRELSTERILRVSEAQRGCNSPSYRHGMAHTKLNHVWNSIKQRCFNQNNKAYKHYGGRGITVCDEWRDNFQAFYDWAMANGYQEGLSIDRIDNNKGYSPENCRWVTMSEQNKNKRAKNGYSIHREA